MRRVDRRTNALPTNRQTDRPTDTASYRGALSHLKSKYTKVGVGERGGKGEEGFYGGQFEAKRHNEEAEQNKKKRLRHCQHSLTRRNLSSSR